MSIKLLLYAIRVAETSPIFKGAKDLQDFGARDYCTPRPDQRHTLCRCKSIACCSHNRIQYRRNPIPTFMDLVLAIKPTQVTLVPDAEDAITSNAGWDTLTHSALKR